MNLRIRTTLQQKLLGVVLLTTLVALIVALGGIVAYNLRADHKNLIVDLSTQSRLLGHMTAPALAFDDKSLALQNLNLLRFRPRVRAAAIYNARGVSVAVYTAAGEQFSHLEIPLKDSVQVQGENLNVFTRIIDDGEMLGTVYLRANYELFGNALHYLGIAALATGVAMLVAFLILVRLQKVVTGPILSIAKIARDVVEQRDYSRRAKKLSDDETGVLIDSFNTMLAEIERRTAELENSNQEIAREVMERRLAQQEIMRLNADLERRVRDRTAQLEITNDELVLAKAAADKANQAKSAFLSSMSHELRTPLNAILGFTQLLASDAVKLTPEKKKSFTGHILKAGNHLLALINEVLDLAKIESGAVTLSLEPVALAEIMQECREMIEPLANQRDIHLAFPQDDKLHIVADRTRLKQVLLNLLSNAIKYNREGGTVILGSAAISAERVRITVQDTGAGLDAGQLKQLFKPFNRLGQEFSVEEGTGIGLVVTKRLVELMGGEIGVASTVGTGSTFWIEMNFAEARNFEGECNISKLAPQANVRADEMAPRTLLYVEDNPANLKLVEEIISFRPDLRLLTATDANLGIELAWAHSPEVILMDINLPGISGIRALQILSTDSRTAHIPVMALTANAMPRDVEKGLQAGFFHYLTKPINIDEFLVALDSALAFAEKTRNQA